MWNLFPSHSRGKFIYSQFLSSFAGGFRFRSTNRRKHKTRIFSWNAELRSAGGERHQIFSSYETKASVWWPRSACLLQPSCSNKVWFQRRWCSKIKVWPVFLLSSFVMITQTLERSTSNLVDGSKHMNKTIATSDDLSCLEARQRRNSNANLLRLLFPYEYSY